SSPVAVDINSRPDSILTALSGHDDWNSLQYSFVYDAESNDGIHTSPRVDDDLTPELAYDVYGILHYAIPFGNGAEQLTLRRNGGLIELFDTRTSAVVASRPFDLTTLVDVVGVDGETDQLTVDYSGGVPIPAGGLFYDGGTGGMDTLNFVGPVG